MTATLAIQWKAITFNAQAKIISEKINYAWSEIWKMSQ